MNSKQLLSLYATVAFFGGHAAAFWRMECRGVTGQARIDPLVNPGEVADHAHEIFGSGGFGESSEYDDLVGSNCTSCAATQDKSAYWTPIPYFKSDAGEYEAVGNVGGMLAYYFLNGEDIKAFPKGFRMIAGDTKRRNYTVGNGDYQAPDPDKSLWRSLNQVTQGDLAQRALGFNCLDYSKAAEGSLYRHFLPSKDYIDANCPDGIRFELMFPSCWDGKNLDSDDHRSHVAYPDLVINGDCPSDFPVRLPGLFYETIWDMAKFSDKDGIFIMSNGDPYGFGYHGDFIMGWEENDSFKLQDAVDICTSTSGTVQDCPVFNLQDQTAMNQCKIDLPGELLKEDVLGPISELPGDVQVFWGPGPASGSPAEATAPSSVVLPTLTYSAGSTASVNGSFVPGNAFKAASTPQPEPMADAVKGAAVVTPAISAAPTGPTEIAYSTAYETTTLADGTVMVNEVVYEEVIDYVTVATTTTVYVDPTGAPAARRRSAHAHHRRHVHGRAH
ncbi:wsc domain-containing protein [Diaporthe eres]|uniref:DUF1996 domain-containing protein n=1 Tax=Diaporthe vaccinii TaxID=105482 RepID=A0ABR4DY27_9PEZI|nr:wsc domain-containing protein [Diaporthe eres]